MRKRAAASEKPVRHISPEEAVAHIQALLDAKHERVQQGPAWPGAAPTLPASSAADLHPPVSGAGGGGDAHVPAPQRNQQSKRKN
ncbi:MAG: hypothetical protein ABI386_09905 [Rhodanobacter sp.]